MTTSPEKPVSHLYTDWEDITEEVLNPFFEAYSKLVAETLMKVSESERERLVEEINCINVYSSKYDKYLRELMK